MLVGFRRMGDEITYQVVPKDVFLNLRYRRIVLELGYSSEEYAKELWILCSRDILFWINTFIYTYNPRLQRSSRIVPFLTYPYQDLLIKEIQYCIEHGYDLMVEKSRDMGVSWIVLMVLLWYWQFRRHQAARLVSRVEDLVDKTEDPDSLFWKIDFAIKHQPIWLRPRSVHRTHLHLKNDETESTIDGYSTTGDVARGGRCGVLFLDEFAAVQEGDRVLSSTRDVSNCRIFVSTHCGTGTAFYRLSFTKIRKWRVHWSDHPEKRKGLYRYERGQVRLLDDYRGPVRSVDGRTYLFPDSYPFRKDGRLRSPWYDEQCDRAAHPMEIAQELDIDPFTSDYQFFEPSVITEIESRDVCPPVVCGMLEYDQQTLVPIRFVENPNGPLRLWFNPDGPNGSVPQEGRYVIGCDISAGTGASNSAASVGNALTKEKIAEFVSPDIKPEAFGEFCIALARWFHNAFLIWDGAGHGRVFGDTVIRRYRNVYYRRREESISKTVSMIPGVFLTPKEKLSILGAYRKALKDGTFIQRSHEANQECLQYVFTTANTVEHSASRYSIDPSGARDNHGDRVIADALLLKGFDTECPSRKEDTEQERLCTFAWRRKLWEQNRKKQFWFDSPLDNSVLRCL